MSDTTSSINTVISQHISTNKSTINFELIEIPKSLEPIENIQILRGQVVRRNNDGTITIKTSKGDIKLKIGQNINISNGDIIELKINKGSPPQIASIRIKNKQIKQDKKIEQLNLTHEITQKIKSQQIISVNEITKVKSLNVTLINKNEIINKVVVPKIENINTSLNIKNISSIIYSFIFHKYLKNNVLNENENKISNVTNINALNFTTHEIDITPRDSPIILYNGYNNEILDNMLQKKENIPISSHISSNLNIFKTEIPSIFITKQLISSPLGKAILSHTQTNNIEINSKNIEIIEEISITDITPPTAINLNIAENTYYHPLDNIWVSYNTVTDIGKNIIKQENIGQLRAIIIGFSVDKNLPIIKIITPYTNNPTDIDGETRQYYILDKYIKNIDIGTNIIFETIKKNEIYTKPSSLNLQTQTQEISITGTTNHLPFISSGIWNVMQEINHLITQIAPELSANFTNIIPNPSSPAQISNMALFFISAIKSGNIDNWLNSKIIDVIKDSNKSGLLSRLSTEFSMISRIYNETYGSEWRTTIIPLMFQNEIHKVIINYRREKNDQTEDIKDFVGEKTRFVVDLNLSNIGNIQLDGLFISNKNKKLNRLDLIIRTKQAFSETMKKEMRRIYSSSLNEIKFTGELSFQHNQNQWVNITSNVKSEFLKDI